MHLTSAIDLGYKLVVTHKIYVFHIFSSFQSFWSLFRNLKVLLKHLLKAFPIKHYLKIRFNALPLPSKLFSSLKHYFFGVILSPFNKNWFSVKSLLPFHTYLQFLLHCLSTFPLTSSVVSFFYNHFIAVIFPWILAWWQYAAISMFSVIDLWDSSICFPFFTRTFLPPVL